MAGVYYWDQEINTRNGRWQVNEFQKGLMNPNNVFVNPVCNPVGAVLEPTPSTTDNPANMRFQPGTSGLVTNGLYAGQIVNLGGAAGTGAGAWQTCQQIYYTAAGGAYDNLARNGQDGWAVFGEATMHLTDKLDLTLGVRQHDQSGYTGQHGRDSGRHGGEADRPAIATTAATRSSARDNAATYTPFEFDKLTSRLALQNQFTDNFMGYVSYSEGFNSGGVSTPTISGARLDPAVQAVDVETTTEIGMRSDLADGMLRFNCDVVRHDLGRPTGDRRRLRSGHGRADPDDRHTTNVGEAKAKGAEFELTIAADREHRSSTSDSASSIRRTRRSRQARTPAIYRWTPDTEFARCSGTELHDRLRAHGGPQERRHVRRHALDYNYQGQFWRLEPFLASTPMRPSRTGTTRAATGAS